MSGGARRAEEERIVPGTPLWDEAYAEHAQRYAFVAARTPAGAAVLDAGCGAGYGAALLADHGAGRVVAVDLAPEAIALARRHFDRPSIRWVTEDAHALEEAGRHGPYDVVCNLENLEHLADAPRFLARAAALLAPDGVLVTSTPSRAGVNRLRGMRPGAGSTNPFHVREYDAAEFRALLEPHFERVTLHHQTLDPIERMHWEPALVALWNEPFARLGRWAQRALRGVPVAERLGDLLPPRRWQILDADPGEGLVVTHLAECRGPRRAAR